MDYYNKLLITKDIKDKNNYMDFKKEYKKLIKNTKANYTKKNY